MATNNNPLVNLTEWETIKTYLNRMTRKITIKSNPNILRRWQEATSAYCF